MCVPHHKTATIDINISSFKYRHTYSVKEKVKYLIQKKSFRGMVKNRVQFILKLPITLLVFLAKKLEA